MAKNSEVYKTAQERSEAFNSWCRNECLKCNIFNNCYENKVRGAMAWLDIECEEEKPLPCIW